VSPDSSHESRRASQVHSQAGDVLLEVAGAVKRFAGILALDGVSIALRAGEVHGLVGENGAGKSTLIKILTGVHRPDEGEVRYLGAPVRFATPQEAQRAGISTIYQEINLVPLMSVAHNLFLGHEPTTRLGLLDTARLHREAREVLSRYGIDVDVTRELGTLGVGTQQMISIVRALHSGDTRVVIMDEPTSALEPREVETLFRVIDQLRAEGVALLYVSHRLDELYRICQHITVLRDGRGVHSGPITELPRLQLVATMLGRDLSDVRERGLTSLEGGHTADAAPVLSAEHLTRHHVLRDVSLAVRPGEVVGLAGLLGAGRSETLKAIAGADPLDAGTVAVGGAPVRAGSTKAAIAAGIALLPEDRKAEGIVGNLSVRDNIVLAALPRLSRAGLVSDKRADELVDTFVRRLRIKASSPHQPVGELSGGNQQKVLLARWLCMEPKVLLLDEPTRGIDVGAKAEVQALVDELAEQGLGVVLVSSDLEEVVEGSDRVVVLRDGAVSGMVEGDDIREDRVLALLATEGAERTRGAADPAGPRPRQEAGGAGEVEPRG